jgi:ABC-type phosphate transport system substrate-binding protein
MRNLRFCFIIMIFSIFALANVGGAGGVKIIVNSSVSAVSISADDIKSIYLQEKNSLGSSSVEPVLLKSGPTHEAFLKRFVSKTNSTLLTFYRSLTFTGKGSMPQAFNSDAEVIAYIAKTKGAIGYISDSSRAEGVKTLEVK